VKKTNTHLFGGSYFYTDRKPHRDDIEITSICHRDCSAPASEDSCSSREHDKVTLCHKRPHALSSCLFWQVVKTGKPNVDIFFCVNN